MSHYLMLRALTKADLGQVVAIEETVQVAPWTEQTFETCITAGYLGWVIDLNPTIIGFIFVAERPSESHILNLCVDRGYQHRGYGKKLLQHAIDHASESGISIAYLEVRRTNAHAIALYRRMRFQLVGIRKDYYPAPHGKEDALIFARDLAKVSVHTL